MSRVIEGLVWAKVLSARPKSIPLARPRGAKAKGLAYERSLARALPEARHGQWFEFLDRNGPGLCQADLIIYLDGTPVVLEAKYTWTAEGHQQLEGLYLPVVQQVWGKAPIGIVVCKVLLPNLAEAQVVVTRNLKEAVELALLGRRTVLHWLGVGPLEPSVPVPGKAHPAARSPGHAPELVS